MEGRSVSSNCQLVKCYVRRWEAPFRLTLAREDWGRRRGGLTSQDVELMRIGGERDFVGGGERAR